MDGGPYRNLMYINIEWLTQIYLYIVIIYIYTVPLKILKYWLLHFKLLYAYCISFVHMTKVKNIYPTNTTFIKELLKIQRKMCEGYFFSTFNFGWKNTDKLEIALTQFIQNANLWLCRFVRCIDFSSKIPFNLMHQIDHRCISNRFSDPSISGRCIDTVPMQRYRGYMS